MPKITVSISVLVMVSNTSAVSNHDLCVTMRPTHLCLRLRIPLFWFCIPLGSLTSVLSQPVGAQNSPSPQDIVLPSRQLQPPSTQPLPPLQTPTRIPSPNELLNTLDTPTEATVTNVVSKTVTVENFEVSGSTVFSAAEFAKVTAPFTNRPLTPSELFQVRDAITQLYLSQGYINSGAYIPPQKIQNKTVEIRIVEGGLESIQVTGTRRLNPAYIKSRLAIASQKPLNRSRLLEALQTLQLNPLIKALSTQLSAGTRAGQSLLTVNVTEAKTFDLQVSLENSRSPSVGTDLRRVQLSEANLLGLGDSVNISYTNTASSNAGDLSYTLPVSPRNATLSFNIGVSSSRVIEKPFNLLDIESKSSYAELTFRQPIVQTPTRQIILGITASQRQSKATLLRGEFPFPALGSDDEGKTRLTALRFFQEWTQRSRQAVFAVRSQFSLGVNALNATISDTTPDSRFLAWRGQVQWVKLLAPETTLLVRSDLQLANQRLLPFEQFGIGGQDTVRGYRQDAVLADNGFFSSAEVRVPILRLPKANTLLQLVPFVEFGKGWTASEQKTNGNRLASVGIGLRLQVSDRITARFDWGIPLTSIQADKPTLQEKGIYFSVICNPF